MGIDSIAIIVSDYEAAKDFYVNKLGFSVIRENYRPERKDWKLDLPKALQSAANPEELTAARPPDVKIGTKKFSKKAKK